MFDLEIKDPHRIEVSSRKYTFTYATDGSKENPLEATFAALAGCAGVYALKACKKRDLNPLGIKITGKPFMDKANPAMISKWITTVSFPQDWRDEDKHFVKEEIQACAVKELITQGQHIDFLTEEA